MRAIGKLGNITPVQKLMLMFVAIFGFMALAMPHLAVAADDEPPYWASIKAEKAYMRVLALTKAIRLAGSINARACRLKF